MQQARMFTERHCKTALYTLYSPELYDFAGYQPQITIIYTHGKDHNWQELGVNDSSASGVVAGAFLNHKQRFIAGAALIDLQTCKPSPRLSLTVSMGGAMKMHSSVPTLAEYHYKPIQVLAHEIFHFIQHWRAGDELDGDDIDSKFSKSYARTYHSIRDAVRKKNPNWSDELIDSATHAKHPREQAAQRFAVARLAKYRRQVERGDWDSCLPIEDMQAYIVQWSSR